MTKTAYHIESMLNQCLFLVDSMSRFASPYHKSALHGLERVYAIGLLKFKANYLYWYNTNPNSIAFFSLFFCSHLYQFNFGIIALSKGGVWLVFL